MAKKNKLPEDLHCTLKKAIVTKEGDFVAEGTPVMVLCWDEKNPKRILVRAVKYMYADNLGKDDGGPIPVIGENLIISVKPSTLLYKHSKDIET